MRKANMVFIGILAAVPLAFGGASEEEYYAHSYARMNYVAGDVYVQRTADLGYEKGEVNLPVVEGDKIGTRDGRVEIHLGRRNYIRLDRDTIVDVIRLPRRGDDRINIHVLEGGVFLRVSELAVDKGIEAHTPDASLYVIEEGLYRIEVRTSGESEFFAYEGSLEIAGEEGSVVLNAYEKLAASNGRFLTNPLFFRAGNAGFEGWNASRDNILSAGTGTRHLPAEMYEYEDELNRSGRWVYERPYGYVWIPLHIQTGWRPYYYGRWVWYPVIGWTWVSSEPWGWSVYRYGRWHWRMGLGWYWIPTRHWGPAWVHWHWDARYVGWSPLSYYNYPVVIINNHFYGRYHGRTYPLHSRALTVVHRSHLQSPGIHRNALRADRVTSLGAVNLRSRQPDIRPAVDRAGPVSLAARSVLARSSVRSVERSSDALRGASPQQIRRLSPSEDAGRSIRERSPDASPQGISRTGQPVRREGVVSAPGRVSPSDSVRSGSGVRSFPSRSDAGAVRSGSSAASGASRGLRRPAESSPPAGGGRGETIRSYPPRSNLPSFGQSPRPASEAGRSASSERGGAPARVNRDADPPSRNTSSTRSSPSSTRQSDGRVVSNREDLRRSSPVISRPAAPSTPRTYGTSSPRTSSPPSSSVRSRDAGRSPAGYSPSSAVSRPPASSSRISAPSSRERTPASRVTAPASRAPISAPRSSSVTAPRPVSSPPSSSVRSGTMGRASSPPSSSVRSGTAARSSPPSSSVRSSSAGRSSPPSSSVRSGSAAGRSSASSSSRGSSGGSGPKKK